MDKMREEFEDWALSEAERVGYPYMDKVLSKFGNCYVTTWVDSAWLGWKASRAALCVELPMVYTDQFNEDSYYAPAVRNALDESGVPHK